MKKLIMLLVTVAIMVGTAVHATENLSDKYFPYPSHLEKFQSYSLVRDTNLCEVAEQFIKRGYFFCESLDHIGSFLGWNEQVLGMDWDWKTKTLKKGMVIKVPKIWGLPEKADPVKLIEDKEALQIKAEDPQIKDNGSFLVFKTFFKKEGGVMLTVILLLSFISAICACCFFWVMLSEKLRPYGFYQCQNGHEASGSGRWRTRFCTQCGVKMRHRPALTCSRGHRVNAGEKFCRRCGVALVQVNTSPLI